MSSRVWKTMGGELIPFEELSTDHLANILSMLERNAEPRLVENGLEPGDVGRIYPEYDELRLEMRKRLAMDVGERQAAKVEAFHQRQFARGAGPRILEDGSDDDGR